MGGEGKAMVELSWIMSVCLSVCTGSGHEWGGLHTEITNHHPSLEMRVLYLDMVPWFCRVYLHTLQINNGK